MPSCRMRVMLLTAVLCGAVAVYIGFELNDRRRTERFLAERFLRDAQGSILEYERATGRLPDPVTDALSEHHGFPVRFYDHNDCWFPLSIDRKATESLTLRLDGYPYSLDSRQGLKGF